MKKFIVGAALVAVIAAPAAAQESVTGAKASVFSITPYAGYMLWGDFFEAANGAEYTQDNSGIFGGEATLDLGRAFSLVGNFGYSKTHFEFEGGTAGETPASQDVGTFLYDGALRVKLRRRKRTQPRSRRRRSSRWRKRTSNAVKKKLR